MTIHYIPLSSVFVNKSEEFTPAFIRFWFSPNMTLYFQAGKFLRSETSIKENCALPTSCNYCVVLSLTLAQNSIALFHVLRISCPCYITSGEVEIFLELREKQSNQHNCNQIPGRQVNKQSC